MHLFWAKWCTPCTFCENSHESLWDKGLEVFDMPQKLKRPCNQPGCPELTHDRYCPSHKKQKEERYERERGSAASRGYDYKWQQYSKRYRKLNPLCVKCLEKGRITPSQHVDHIKAVNGPNDPLFYEPTNHQALCQPCHNAKTIIEDKRGFGR